MKKIFLMISVLFCLDSFAMEQGQSVAQALPTTNTKLTASQRRRIRRKLATQQNHQVENTQQEGRKKQNKCKDRGICFSSGLSGKSQSTKVPIMDWFLIEKKNEKRGDRKYSLNHSYYGILCEEQNRFSFEK